MTFFLWPVTGGGHIVCLWKRVVATDQSGPSLLEFWDRVL